MCVPSRPEIVWLVKTDISCCVDNNIGLWSLLEAEENKTTWPLSRVLLTPEQLFILSLKCFMHKRIFGPDLPPWPGGGDVEKP